MKKLALKLLLSKLVNKVKMVEIVVIFKRLRNIKRENASVLAREGVLFFYISLACVTRLWKFCVQNFQSVSRGGGRVSRGRVSVSRGGPVSASCEKEREKYKIFLDPLAIM